MTDITQGQESSDGDLFRQALDTTTLEKFENPELPPEPKPEPKPPEPKAGDPPKPEPPDAPVPSGRFREEAEARRKAERERDELRGRLDAFQQRQPPAQQQAPQKVDMFDNPSGFIKQEVSPFLDQFRQELQMTREAMSLDNAINRHGDDKVMAARQALEQGMQRGDQNIWSLYNRAMQSHDPYGVIVKWHHEREVLSSIGGDLDGFKKKLREEALSDPEFLKVAIERAKGGATQSVNRPVVVQSSVPKMPSLSNVGSGGGDEQQIEPSDEQLFRAAVSAKRR